MKQTIPQEDVEGLIANWCAENGFGSDPVTLSTFEDLAYRLLDALSDRISYDYKIDTVPSLTPGVDLSDGDSVDRLLKDSLLSPFTLEESFQPTMPPDATAPDRNVKSQAQGTIDAQSGPSPCFLDASGDWRVVFDDDHWWAVGRNVMFPAKDRDDAERRCQELRYQFSSMGECS